MNGKTKSRTTVITVIAVAVVAAAILVFYSRSWQQVVQVNTARVTYQDQMDTVSTNGKVEPIVQYLAHSSAPGIVEKLYVALNDKVRPGQLLVEMDDRDAAARLASSNANLKAQLALQHDMQQGGSQDERNKFQADLGRAESQLQDAQRSLAAVQALQKTGGASPAEVQQVQGRVNAAQANVDSVHTLMNNRYSPSDLARNKAQIADAEAAVHAASGTIATMDIRSPIGGTVYSRKVSQYDYVPAGDELLTVADLTKMRIRAYFDEPDIGKLAAGQPVQIEWEAKHGHMWHGHVQVAPTTVTSYGTRNVGECIITVDDANGDLPPNADVTVTVTSKAHRHVLSIPHEALRTDGPLNFVYVVQGGHLVRTPVQLGIVNHVSVEITGGLSENQTVALGAIGSHELSDGLQVAPADKTHE